MHVVENTFRVRYAETDQMGIVYHSNYYIWFDMGRTEFLRALGFDYSKMEEDGILLPVLETHCIYKKPARFDELITVKTSLKEFNGVRVAFRYEVYNEKGEHLSSGLTVQAAVNKGMHPVNLKKAMPEVYEKLVSCLSE